jgi:hypothetical protein
MSASSASSLGTDALAPGTELIVDRLAYRHHGIYLGEGLVIHYAGRIRYPHGLIEAVPLRSFVGKRHVHVGRRPAESRHGEAIVRRARSRLGERRYAILSNNCEHFCSWCQVGESRSKQVDRLLQRIRAVRCAVWSIFPRRCGSYLKRGLRVVLSSKSIAAKCLRRFSFADSTVPTVWESRAVSGGRC